MPENSSITGELTLKDLAYYHSFAMRSCRRYRAGTTAYGYLKTAWDKLDAPLYEDNMLVHPPCPIECDETLPPKMVKVLDGRDVLVEVWILGENGEWILADMKKLREACRIDPLSWTYPHKEAADA